MTFASDVEPKRIERSENNKFNLLAMKTKNGEEMQRGVNSVSAYLISV